MKRLMAAVLLFVGFGLLVFAQRSGSRGGSPGRAAASSHTRFAPTRSAGHYARQARYSRMRPSLARRAAPSRRQLDSAARSPYRNDWRYRRRPYVSPYAWTVPYAPPGWGYLPGDLDYGASDDSPAPQSTAMNDYPQPPAQPESPAKLPAYRPPAAPAHLSTLAQDDGSVTLIFKDGRAPMHIHNYVLTRTTLFVQGLGHREIALDQLDMVATLKANHDAGIEFSLPEGPE